jgi:hypothetical protein
MTYIESLTAAMNELAIHPMVMFLGQDVAYKDMSITLKGVPRNKRIELTVAEEMQLGISIGLSLARYIPVSIYPRWNFPLFSANQLVNLDKMKTNIIIRVVAGPQDMGNVSKAFELMCPNTRYITLENSDMILPAYREAIRHKGTTVLTEIANLYE